MEPNNFRQRMRITLILISIVLSFGALCCIGYFGWHAYQKIHVPPVASLLETYRGCIELGDDRAIGNCLEKMAEKAYSAYPVADISATLSQLTYEEKNRWCHETMHYLGWQAYAVEGNIADAFLNSSELCDSGMYHGVTEAFLRKEGLTDQIESIVKNTCEEALSRHPDLSSGTKSLCYHGLGHGLMYVTASDLRKSLDYCDLLQGSNNDDCYGGVFMEYAASKAVGPLSNDIDMQDVTYCDALTDHQKDACYGRQGVNYLSFAKGDVATAMNLCLRLPPQYQSGCFEGVGTNNPSPSKSDVQAGTDCLHALDVSGDAYRGCIVGSLNFIVQLDRGALTGTVDFCETAPEKYKPLCYSHAGAGASYWLKTGETLAEKCAIVPEAYRALCVTH
jgi:hypothetical protein